MTENNTCPKSPKLARGEDFSKGVSKLDAATVLCVRTKFEAAYEKYPQLEPKERKEK